LKDEGDLFSCKKRTNGCWGKDRKKKGLGDRGKGLDYKSESEEGKSIIPTLLMAPVHRGVQEEPVLPD